MNLLRSIFGGAEPTLAPVLPERSDTEYALDRAAKAFRRERDEARQALRDIIALETPSCASIGKRMAARAKAALPPTN